MKKCHCSRARIIFSVSRVGKLDIHIEEKKVQPLPYTIHKNQFHVNCRSQCEILNKRALKIKTRTMPYQPWSRQRFIQQDIKSTDHGLPWWRSGWESACQCRGHGFEPWPGKIPHATEQLGPWATITEPARLEPVLRNKRGHDSERPTHRDEEWPPLATTRESPRTETKTEHSHK